MFNSRQNLRPRPERVRWPNYVAARSRRPARMITCSARGLPCACPCRRRPRARRPRGGPVRWRGTAGGGAMGHSRPGLLSGRAQISDRNWLARENDRLLRSGRTTGTASGRVPAHTAAAGCRGGPARDHAKGRTAGAPASRGSFAATVTRAWHPAGARRRRYNRARG
jgi:hypothetical protein